MNMDETAVDAEWHAIRIGAIKIKYYVREPSPGRWNAIGVIHLPDGSVSCRRRCPLIVGVGATYYEAVGDLMARSLSGDHPDLPKMVIEREAGKVRPVDTRQPLSASDRTDIISTN
jgi:hypothetical protein